MKGHCGRLSLYSGDMTCLHEPVTECNHLVETEYLLTFLDPAIKRILLHRFSLTFLSRRAWKTVFNVYLCQAE